MIEFESATGLRNCKRVHGGKVKVKDRTVTGYKCGWACKAEVLLRSHIELKIWTSIEKYGSHYILGVFNEFPDFFWTGIWNCRRLLKMHYVIAIHLMRWQTNFYDFRFKGTATATIRIHPTKAWLSQLVNFKNAIWTWGHFRRTICNKILF